MLDSPLRFRPYFRPMIWGGRHLADVLGQRLPTDEPYGEAWVVSDHPSHHSVVATGPHAGRTLHELMLEHPETLLGRQSAPAAAPAAGEPPAFPWLIKFLDAHEKLSVQVHPDDEAAARLWPGENGKTEAWFVLAAKPGSVIYAGLLPGVDERQLRRAVDAGHAADCLHQFAPRAGDVMFLPAGTVHAVGGGVLMAEVQQSSDATFRLYDWGRVDAQGRPRQLHVEQGMACIDWGRGPVQPIRAEGYPQQHGEAGAGGGDVRQALVRCPFFDLDYLRQTVPFDFGGAGGRMRALLVLHGEGRIDTGHGEEALSAGDTLLLPAAMGQARCRPEGALGVLVATMPPGPSVAA